MREKVICGDSSGASLGPDATSDDLVFRAEIILAGGVSGNQDTGTANIKNDGRFIIQSGKGGRVRDTEGNWHVDYLCGSGGLILGHSPPEVIHAIQDQAERGVHFFGMLNEPCIRLADRLMAAIPCAEKIGFCCTGSEATFFALRLARAFTDRQKILKFEGGYHGNHDYVNIGYAPKSLSDYPEGKPDFAGIPASIADDVLVAPYNDLDAVSSILQRHGKDIAAIIVEPVQRIVMPEDGFLDGLRQLSEAYGIVLIFDEVVTGFRLAYGGAQEWFGVTPDLACYGKTIGGGTAIACIAGRAEILDLCNASSAKPGSQTKIAGTLRGNALNAAAASAVISKLAEPGFFEALNSRTQDFTDQVQKLLDRHGVPALALCAGSMWQIMFTDRPPRCYADDLNSDQRRTRNLDLMLRRNGHYLIPGVRKFMSSGHSDEDLDFTLQALDRLLPDI